MSNNWKSFEDSDATRQPPPDWCFWPGVIVVVGGLLYLLKAIVKAIVG